MPCIFDGHRPEVVIGNFYTNIALRTTKADAVAAVLEDLRRRAFIGGDAGAVVVFDEACDTQDLDELERLASLLSKRLACAALAVCNHDDDVLWYALVEAGKVVDRYESNPSSSGGGKLRPTGGDAARLCAAFGVAHERAVDEVLRRPHADVVFEIERHQALQRLLRLPESLSVLGYRYVQQGDLEGDPAAATLKQIGGSALRDKTATRSTSSSAEPAAMDESTRAAIEREGKDIMSWSYALALSEADVPPQFVSLFGASRGNGHLLLTRLHQYIVSHDLRAGRGWIDADDLLGELLGERRFVIVAAARLLCRALGVPPLSAEDASRLQRGDPDLLRRLQAAIGAAVRDAGAE